MFKKILFLFTLFVFCIGICCINNHPDNDLWGRLIVGQYISETLGVAKYDFLSYMPTHKWFDHEWGASLIFYLVLKNFGASGLIILRGILLSLTLFFCFLTVKERNSENKEIYNILYYAIMFLFALKSTGSTVRCLLFTSFFFSVFLYILERARNGKSRELFLLPFIMVLWCNIHGGCLSGLGIIAIYSIGELLNGKHFKKYIYVLFVCLMTLFINPYGFEYVKFLFETGFMHREFISEWLSPFDSHFVSDYMGFKVFLVLMTTALFGYLKKNKFNYNPVDKTKIITVFVMTYLSITHIRHISFFIFTAGTLLYEDFYYMAGICGNKLTQLPCFKNKNILESISLLKDSAVYFILFITSFPFLISPVKDIKITGSEYPRFAVEFIKINKISGNLFISFDFGSYASYKLYPQNLVVMDGRYEETYDPDLLYLLKNFHQVKNDWYKIIREYRPDVMIIEKKYPVYAKICDNNEWVKVFENNLSGVFVPVSDLKETYLLPRSDDEYYNNTVFDTDINFKDKKS